MLRFSITSSLVFALIVAGQARVVRAALRIDAIGDLPGGQVRSEALGISADGRYVVGRAWTGGENNAEAFVWDLDTGIHRLATGSGTEDSQAFDISADGQTVAGFRFSQACIWRIGQGVAPLRTETAGNSSAARAISDNGTVVAGYAWTSSSLSGFRWTQATSMTPVNGSYEVNGISADGTTTIDRSPTNTGEQAVIRKSGSPSVGLGVGTRGLGLSADGSVAVGSTPTADGRRAFRWTRETGLVPLGGFYAEANDVSADGKTIVGTDTFSPNGGANTAFVWTPGDGSLRIASVLTNAGVDLSHWQILQYATAVSSDGLTIAGYGINAAGQTEAFRAVLPEPATLFSLSALGILIMRRR